MSTPMCDDFYSGEMSDYSCLQRYNGFEDKPTFGDGVDPRLLSSPNSPMMSSEHGLDQFNQGTQHMLQDNFEPFSDMAPPQHQHQQQHHPAFFDQDMSLSSYKPLRHQMLGHRRSVSVPPEDFAAEVSQHPPPPQPAMVFHRGGTPLGDSMGTCKGGNKRWLKKASAAAVSQQQKRRHQPYPSMQNIAAAQSPSVRVGMKRSQTQPTGSLHGPTSAPVLDHMHYTREVGHGVSSSGLQFDMNAQTLPQFTEFDMVYPDITTTTNADLKNGIAGVPTNLIDIDSLLFGSRGHADSAVLGMLGFADRIARDCEAMRSFLGHGYKGVGRNDDDDELESLRQEKRLINRKVTGLDDLVQELPLPAGKSEMQEHVNIPATGSEIRELSVGKTHEVLELYEIPFSKDMFLHDKKLAYLRFVGAGHVLMRAVLD